MYVSSDYSAIFQLHAELSSLKTVNSIRGKNGGFEAISFSLFLSYSLSHFHTNTHTHTFSHFHSFSFILLHSHLTAWASSAIFFSFLDTIFYVRFTLSTILFFVSSCSSLCLCTTTAGASFYRVVNQSRRIFFLYFFPLEASSGNRKDIISSRKCQGTDVRYYWILRPPEWLSPYKL